MEASLHLHVSKDNGYYQGKIHDKLTNCLNRLIDKHTFDLYIGPQWKIHVIQFTEASIIQYKVF